MAKPRKQKNGQSQKHTPEVLHQKICLSIDVKRRLIFGFTEIKVKFSENGTIGLHAENMVIESVMVNGEPTEFQFSKYYQDVEDGLWNSVTCASEAAEAASGLYISSLERESLPNLLISRQNTKALDVPVHPTDRQGDPQNSPTDTIAIQNRDGEAGHGCVQEKDQNQNVQLVRINYHLECAEPDTYLSDDVLFIDNHTRHSHCWFPCIDSCMHRCCYDLELTVDLDFVAISTGRLLFHILTDDSPPRKTFVYSLDIPVSAGWITLVVASFEYFFESHKSLLSYFCLPKDLSMLHNTVGFFHTVFSHYEDYLAIPFPFGSYTQVFIPPELLSSSISIGASVSIISSDVLFDEKIIDQIIDARVKLAHALARQWFGGYIVPESPSDEWLIDGLAGFLMDSYARRFLGNNEARYRRYKANSSVCQVDITGATALGSIAAANNLYGTQSIGLYGKIRSWKAVAVLQMLEKQMGPESFRKILQVIVGSFRALSTREFRHLANKIGNLERPFLKEFFPRWVDSCGSPVLRLGLSYLKRKNILELAAMRGSTSSGDPSLSDNTGNEKQDISSWPGMMSIRVHEINGVYDHPSLPLSGDALQLLEIQLHSRLASKRFQKTKKGIKLEGSDDNGDAVSVLDAHSCLDSPLLWIRIDPEMEYLSEVHFHQPVQMWINQLEKDRDVVAQSEAITVLKSISPVSFPVVSALSNLLNDSKAFWRVRIEAAFALAHLSSKENDWAGLLHLIKFYKNRRFDMEIGLPKPNNFLDVPEYYVLEAIPLAIAMVRASDQKSPREAVEFILLLLKYNDNNGNPYSDVYWLASLVQSIGDLELGNQSLPFVPSLLKCIDRLLHFDRLMPSYNGVITISCIHTLAQFALKMLPSLPVGYISDLIKSFRDLERSTLKVRLQANISLLNLEFYGKGFDAAVFLFLELLSKEISIRGQVKLAVHMMRLCHANINSELRVNIKNETLIALLNFFATRKCFNNFILRHHLFCIFQIIAERSPTLYALPRVHMQPMTGSVLSDEDKRLQVFMLKSESDIPVADAPVVKDDLLPVVDVKEDVLLVAEPAKETDVVSNSTEKRILKIRVKQPSASRRADELDNMVGFSRAWNEEAELGPTSSVSVDAPPNLVENAALSTGVQMTEEVYSWRGPESRITASVSRITASVGSVKILDSEDIGKELQCTADSKSIPEDQRSPINVETYVQQDSVHVKVPDMKIYDAERALVSVKGQASADRQKKEKKHKHKKRKREEKTEGKDRQNDPEYLERKRLKKERRRLEKEMRQSQLPEVAKSTHVAEPMDSTHVQHNVNTPEWKSHPPVILKTSAASAGPSTSKGTEAVDSSSRKVKIRIKSRALGNI